MVLPQFGLARRSVDRWFRARKIAPRISNEVPGNEALLSLVALGCGVGVVPRLVLENSPLTDRVRELPVRPALPPFRIGFCTRARRIDSPIVSAFWDSIGE